MSGQATPAASGGFGTNSSQQNPYGFGPMNNQGADFGFGYPGWGSNQQNSQQYPFGAPTFSYGGMGYNQQMVGTGAPGTVTQAFANNPGDYSIYPWQNMEGQGFDGWGSNTTQPPTPDPTINVSQGVGQAPTAIPVPPVTANPGTPEYKHQVAAQQAVIEKNMAHGISPDDMVDTEGVKISEKGHGASQYKFYTAEQSYYGPEHQGGNFTIHGDQKLDTTTGNPLGPDDKDNGPQFGTIKGPDGLWHWDPNNKIAWEKAGQSAADVNQQLSSWQSWQGSSEGIAWSQAWGSPLLAWYRKKRVDALVSSGRWKWDPKSQHYYTYVGAPGHGQLQLYNEYGIPVGYSPGSWGMNPGTGTTPVPKPPVVVPPVPHPPTGQNNPHGGPHGPK